MQCQSALEESTKREIEQLQMIMELKAEETAEDDEDEELDENCRTCQAYEAENELLREQSNKQQEVIDKLSQA